MEFGRLFGVVLLICLSLFSCSTEGYRFYVGGRDGWVVSPSESYSHWAERNRFQVNDTLYFKYNKGSDSVLEVNKDDFFNCNTNNPIKKLDGGNSEFTFDQSGPYYFISGQNGNCAKGQKLVIIVLALRHHQQPSLPPVMPPATAPSPSPLGPKPPSPSPSPGVANPPAASPAPWSSPAVSPVPAPSPGTTPPTTSPATPPTTSPATPPTTSPGTPPTLSPPSPPPVGTPPTPSAEPPAPSPPGVVTAPPPGSENSTAPGPPGSGGVRATSSSVLVSWAVVLVSVALMSSFVRAGAA